ncbi:MAG: thiamine phosphate synthase [Pseudohongiellaceae bacterium]
MKFSGIYAITDDELLPGARLLDGSRAALESGIALLQYRSKSTNAAQRLENASKLAALCSSFDIPLLINDDVELCRAANASGVHLGREDGSLLDARERLGSTAIIGATCHASIEAALLAEQHGADYVAFGRFFPSNTKPHAAAAELGMLNLARKKLNIPIVAIGGINAQNGASVIEAGADMLAVIHSLFAYPDIAQRARELTALFPRQSAKQ